MSLETAVARVFQNQPRFTFVQIGPDLSVVEQAGNFDVVLPGSPESAVNQPLSRLIPAFAGHEDQLQAVLDGEKAEFELKYVKKELADDSTLYHNMRVVPLPDEDGETGLLLIIEEVTNTAKMGQQLVYYNKILTQAQEKLATAESELAQLNQFKKYLLSMLSHDMRTPLAAIRGYAELLHRLVKTNQVAANPEKAFSFADNICYITDQMTWLINDIIDLNLSENGALELSLERCNMQEVIEETVEMYDSIIKMQHLSLSLELNPPGLLVLADPQRLRQIANNLIGNAIKRTPQGGEFAIQTAVEGGTAVLTVTDTGPAMSDEEIEKIFQPYYRSKEAKVSNILGSGLGLHIVKVLVEAQNGRIDVNQGTTYSVHLPLPQ